jgi:hypothetical protein
MKCEICNELAYPTGSIYLLCYQHRKEMDDFIWNSQLNRDIFITRQELQYWIRQGDGRLNTINMSRFVYDWEKQLRKEVSNWIQEKKQEYATKKT